MTGSDAEHDSGTYQSNIYQACPDCGGPAKKVGAVGYASRYSYYDCKNCEWESPRQKVGGCDADIPRGVQ